MHGSKLALVAALAACLVLALVLWGPGGAEPAGVGPGVPGPGAPADRGSGPLEEVGGAQAEIARAVIDEGLPDRAPGEAAAEALPGWDLVLTGRVLTSGGAPIEGATVELLLDRRSSYSQFGEVDGALGAVQGTMTIAADGAFRFPLERPVPSALRV